MLDSPVKGSMLSASDTSCLQTVLSFKYQHFVTEGCLGDIWGKLTWVHDSSRLSLIASRPWIPQPKSADPKPIGRKFSLQIGWS